MAFDHNTGGDEATPSASSSLSNLRSAVSILLLTRVRDAGLTSSHNNKGPGNTELQDVWMPRPDWSIGLRANADGSGGTVSNNYADFGVVKMTFNGSRSATVSYVSSKNGSTIDEFTIYK